MTLDEHISSLTRSPAPPINNDANGIDPWRAAHSREFIGASEAAAAVGLSPFQTRPQFIESKIFGQEPFDQESQWRMLIGHEMEPVVLRMAMERHVHGPIPSAHITYQDKEWSWLSATPDSWHTGFNVSIEVKTTAGWDAQTPPKHIISQLVVQCRVLQTESVVLAVAKPHIKKLLNITVVVWHVNGLWELLPFGQDEFWKRMHDTWDQIRG